MNALQWWVLAGLMISTGLVSIVWYVVPAQPDLADTFARLAPASSSRRVTNDPDAPVALADRVGLWAVRHLPGGVWGSTPQRDLAILGRTAHRFYGEKLLFAGILAAGVPVLAAIYSTYVAIPPPFVVGATLIGVVAGWLVPNGNVASAAADARLEFNRALSSYVDLVALERSAGGSAPRQALENAVEIGDSWPFRRISDELARSRFSGEPPWDAIHHLADELGLPVLDDVADIMRLAGAEGSQVYDTLRARSIALRSALLTAEQAKAKALSTRMTIPTTLMGITFCVLVATPAILRLITG